jgi:hypothetical protein
MGRLINDESQKLKILNYILKASKDSAINMSEVVNVANSFKTSEMLLPSISKHMVPHSQYSYRILNKELSELAMNDHEHDEYVVKGETVESAYNITDGINDYGPKDLAAKDHTHNYVTKDEIITVTENLSGVPHSTFARKEHEHPEYYKKDDVVPYAVEIDGTRVQDLAMKEHNHGSDYYKKDDIVEDTTALKDDAGNLFTQTSFAPKQHDHDDLYDTKESAMKKFLSFDEPIPLSDYIYVDVYNINATSNIDPGRPEAYLNLQYPNNKNGFKTGSSMDATTTKIKSNQLAKVVKLNTSVSRGRYVEFELSLENNLLESGKNFGEILGIMVQQKLVGINVNDNKNVPPNYVMAAWDGYKIKIYAYDFPQSSTVDVDLLIFIAVN